MFYDSVTLISVSNGKYEKYGCVYLDYKVPEEQLTSLSWSSIIAANLDLNVDNEARIPWQCCVTLSRCITSSAENESVLEQLFSILYLLWLHSYIPLIYSQLNYCISCVRKITFLRFIHNQYQFEANNPCTARRNLLNANFDANTRTEVFHELMRARHSFGIVTKPHDEANEAYQKN